MSEAPRTLAPVITWRTTLVTAVDCSTCKLVALVLSLYMNERGGSAFPSVPTLAHDCSLSERSVRQHLNDHLHVQGWLTLVERGGLAGQRRRANEWRASTPAGVAGVLDMTPAGGSTTPATGSVTPAGDAAHLVHEQVQELGGSPFRCPRRDCNQRFVTLEERDVHYDRCFGATELLSAAEIEIEAAQ